MNTINATNNKNNAGVEISLDFRPGKHDVSAFMHMMDGPGNQNGMPRGLQRKLTQVLSDIQEKLDDLLSNLNLQAEKPTGMSDQVLQILSDLQSMLDDLAGSRPPGFENSPQPHIDHAAAAIALPQPHTSGEQISASALEAIDQKLDVAMQVKAPLQENPSAATAPVSAAKLRADLQQRASSPWSRYDLGQLPRIEFHLDEIMKKMELMLNSLVNDSSGLNDGKSNAIENKIETIADMLSKMEQVVSQAEMAETD